jgi:hypothetical protein
MRFKTQTELQCCDRARNFSVCLAEKSIENSLSGLLVEGFSPPLVALVSFHCAWASRCPSIFREEKPTAIENTSSVMQFGECVNELL